MTGRPFDVGWHMVPATIAARMTIWVWGVMGISQGVLIAIGGPIRWESGVLHDHPPSSLVAPYSWAMVAFAAGAIALTGSLMRNNTVRNIGLFITTVWYGSFAIGGGTSATLSPTVGTTSPPTCIAIALVIVIAMFIDERGAPMILGQPPPELRNPFELSIFGALVAFSFGAAFGTRPLPGSLQEQTDLYGQSTGALIFIGSLVCVVGLLWMWDRMNAYVIYQFGCVGTSAGCLMYALALWLVHQPTDTYIVFGMFTGMGVGCFLRWLQINRWWRRERRRARRLLDEVQA